jgi:hypothetical protein
MFRACRVSRRRAYAAVTLRDEIIVVETLVRRVRPVLDAHALVQVFGQRLRETIGKRL